MPIRDERERDSSDKLRLYARTDCRLTTPADDFTMQHVCVSARAGEARCCMSRARVRCAHAWSLRSPWRASRDTCRSATHSDAPHMTTKAVALRVFVVDVVRLNLSTLLASPA